GPWAEAPAGSARSAGRTGNWSAPPGAAPHRTAAPEPGRRAAHAGTGRYRGHEGWWRSSLRIRRLTRPDYVDINLFVKSTTRGGRRMQIEITTEHRWLQALAGEWVYEGECSMGADQPSMKFTGSETVRGLGEAWIVGEGKG